MKFKLIFKTPDVLDQLDKETSSENLRFLAKYLKYDEIITVEFDTETETAEVIRIGE